MLTLSPKKEPIVNNIKSTNARWVQNFNQSRYLFLFVKEKTTILKEIKNYKYRRIFKHFSIKKSNKSI